MDLSRRAAVAGLGAAMLAPGALAQAARDTAEMWLTEGGNLAVRMKVNGDPFVALLDNGLPASVIDTRLATERGWASQQGVLVTGVPTLTRNAMRFTVGSARESVRPRLIDLSPFGSERGQPVSVMVGPDLLNGLRITLDFDGGALRLEPRARKAPAPAGAAVLKLSGDLVPKTTLPGAAPPNLPAMETGLEGSAPVETFVDLGSYAPLQVSDGPLTASWFADGRRWSNILAYHQGIVGSAEATNIVTTLKTVTVGPFTLRDVPVEIFSPGHDQKPDSTLAVIGPALLSRFLATLDPVAKELLLLPGRDFEKPFRKSVTGVQSKPEGERLRVMYVGDNSPAREAGVAKDTVITGINGGPASRETLRGFKAGEKVELAFADGAVRAFEAREYY